MVEIPYTLIRTTFVELTSFRPSFLDPSSPGLTLTPMKCVQNKKLMIFYWFIVELHDYVNLEENPEFSPSHWWIERNIKKTTGLLMWSKTIGTQTHAHTYIHRNTRKKDKNYTFIPDIPPVCIDILQAENNKRPQNSPPQRPDPSQVAVTCRGSRSSP